MTRHSQQAQPHDECVRHNHGREESGRFKKS
jgi:hypothetical protein